MATYNLTNSIPSTSSLAAGDILNCDYSGSYISITLPAGAYALEAWGASGGVYNSTAGTPGKGGYSTGDLMLEEDTTLYLYSGGQGSVGSSANTTSHSGGFNGGGLAYGRAGSGGGASDIRIASTSLYARVLVAGGGGGAPYSGGKTAYSVVTGGDGGGLTGGIGGYGSSNTKTGVNIANPGTQTAAGANSTNASNTVSATSADFGNGAGSSYYSSNYASGGGGGGWYGGGVGRYYYAGGAGGSGYVYSENTATNYPSGCLLNSSYYLTNTSTIDGSNQFVSTSGSNETGHSGNGYIRITIISLGTVNKYQITSSTSVTEYELNPLGEQDIFEGATSNLYIYGDNLNRLILTDNNVDMTNSVTYVEEDLENTKGLLPSGYDTTNSSYQSISNASDALSGYASSAYATITLNSSGSSYFYLNFDTSSIPSNAVINSITGMTKAYISSTSNFSSYTAGIYSGTSLISSTTNLSTSSSEISFEIDNPSIEQIEDLKIGFAITRSGSSSGGNSYYLYVYGGNITINYTIPNGNTYSLYVLTNIDTNHTIVITQSNLDQLFLKSDNQWISVKSIYLKQNGSWIKQEPTYLSTENIKYLRKGN